LTNNIIPLNGKAMTKTKTRPRRLEHLERDRGYRFTDRDPILELVSRAITDSGWSLKGIEDKCGVTTTTLRAWQSGRTRRPQNSTVEMVLRTLGWSRVIYDPRGRRHDL
jgi:hypothetical protein